VIGLTVAIERNRLTNIVNDNLARIAAGKMLRKLLADLGQPDSVDVVVEGFQKFFTGPIGYPGKRFNGAFDPRVDKKSAWRLLSSVPHLFEFFLAILASFNHSHATSAVFGDQH
jgi:hypothetical protein